MAVGDKVAAGLGWRPRPADQRDYPMRQLVRRAVAPSPRKTWRLRRSRTLDQGDSPCCVGATGKHHEWCLPIAQDSGRTFRELYDACKARDGYPTEEGTDARALVAVYKALGLVESYHFADNEADIRAWVLTRGPVMFGAYWKEGNASVGADGLGRYLGEDIGGHETLILGYAPGRRIAGQSAEYEFCNSWGRSFGKDGRFFLSAADVAAMLAATGDAVGVIQARRTA